MFSSVDAGNLIGKALVVARALACCLLSANDYWMLIISVSFVYEFVRRRKLAKTPQDQASRRSEINTPSLSEPV